MVQRLPQSNQAGVGDLKNTELTIDGKRVPIRFVNRVEGGNAGLCCWLEDGGVIISINRKQPKPDVLETVVHEVIHAKLPYLSESDVSELGELIRKALYQTGIVG